MLQKGYVNFPKMTVKNNFLKNMNVSFYMHCKISGWENEGILWDFNSSVNELPDEEWHGICLNKERIHFT
jgi:hypothetical protein